MKINLSYSEVSEIKPQRINRKQARLFLLRYQGLLPPRNLTGKERILEFIQRTGCIQFDPLNKVGRNPDLLLQARVEDYRPELLAELLYKERELLDGWDKNMSIYHREDWPFFRRYRERARKRLGDPEKPAAQILPRVREEIRQKGPLSSLDLKYDRVVDWSWAPTRVARAALESMYSWGELIIHHKVGTRKVYDFSKKYLPAGLLSAPDPNPDEKDYLRWRVLRRIGGIGLVHARISSESTWLGIGELDTRKLQETVAGLLEDNLLREIKVEGIKEAFYLRAGEAPLLQRILAGTRNDGVESGSSIDDSEQQRQAAFLAPLDNLLWNRELIKELFDFEYVWEVYKPVVERKYGYYVLPVLYGDRFVARFEPELDRKNRELIIKNWWWEPGTGDLNVERLDRAITGALREFLNYLGAVKLNNCGFDNRFFKINLDRV